MTPTYLALAIITFLTACPSLYYSVREMRNPDPEARIVARYAAARSLALFVVAIVPFFGPFEGWLLAIAVAMIIVQTADTFVAIPRGKAGMIFGPASAAAVNLAALIVFLVVR